MAAHFDNLRLVDHPLVQARLGVMREASCGLVEFRRALETVAPLVFYEAARDLPTSTRHIVTPIGETQTKGLACERLVLVPILRAGLGMLMPIVTLCPDALIGTIGVVRNEETLEPHCYQRRLPPVTPSTVAFILDPMLATGGTLRVAIKTLVDHGCRDVRLVSIVAAPEGVRHVTEAYPGIRITAAALDEGLNDLGYIVPGLGDAGDRYFGTL